MFLATLQHLTACLALTGLVHAAPSSLAPRTTTNAVAEVRRPFLRSSSSREPNANTHSSLKTSVSLILLLQSRPSASTKMSTGTRFALSLPVSMGPLRLSVSLLALPPSLFQILALSPTRLRDSQHLAWCLKLKMERHHNNNFQGSSPTKRVTMHSFWWGAVLRTQSGAATIP